MNQKDNYLSQISARGDRYGYRGGLYDLLTWCDKPNLREVTESEALCFLLNPNAQYRESAISA